LGLWTALRFRGNDEAAMEFLRYASSVYGQPVLLGASWNLLPWFFGAGVVFIVAHAAYKAVTGSRGP
jgi:hypothetical protein